MTGAEAMVRMLQLHGVKHIFGLCGDTSLPFYDALYRLDHGMQHILTRDERSAAYMADGYARVSGRVGVCEGPSGGGATYLLPGIVEANESSIPVLGITTDIATTSRGRYTLTELDQEALYRPLTKRTEVIDRADRLPEAVRRAFRAMTTGRPGAAHLGLPFDVQNGQVAEDERLGARRNSAAIRRAAPRPMRSWSSARRPRWLRRRMPMFVCGGGVVIANAEAGTRRARDAAGRAGRHHRQRPGQPGRRPSAVPRRRRQQRRHPADARSAGAGGPGGVRRLPRGLGDHRALALSGAGHARDPHRRRPDGPGRELQDRGRAGRRREAGAAGIAV